jgi:hypothetical protein
MARSMMHQARKGHKSAKSSTRTSRRPARSHATSTPKKDPALQAFFDELTACLTAGDGGGAATCFEYPALMVMSNRTKYGPNQPLPDVGTVAGFFAKAPEMYQARGITDTFADIEDVQWLADDLAAVRVRFPYIDNNGNDMGDGETSLYVLRKDGDTYRICTAVTLGVDSDRGGSA